MQQRHRTVNSPDAAFAWRTLYMGFAPWPTSIVIGEVHECLLALTTERGFHLERRRPLMKAYATRTQYLPSERSLTPSSPRDEDRQRGNQRVHPDDAGLAFENVERNRQDHDG